MATGYRKYCDVKVARTGEYLYKASEFPADMLDSSISSDDIIVVYRDEADVFAEDSLASFEHKPITMDHPEDDVEPSNWRQLAVGHVVNARRDSDGVHVICDMIVQDEEAFNFIESGNYEISCGYWSDINIGHDGRLSQTNIKINHVAIVEKGRCGDTCALNTPVQMTDGRIEGNGQIGLGSVMDLANGFNNLVKHYEELIANGETIRADILAEMEKAIQVKFVKSENINWGLLATCQLCSQAQREIAKKLEKRSKIIKSKGKA